MMNITKTVALIAICALGLPAHGMSGDEILKISDSRFIPRICSYIITIKTEDQSKKTSVNVAKGYKKGNDRNVIIVREPKRIAGSVHLRRGNVVWSYYTTNKRLMKMAYHSTFMGTMVNYGDIMATELSYDYNVKETKVNPDAYVLTLVPKPGHEGYAKIVLTIDRKTMLPKKREYYALSGILMKMSDVKEIRTQNNVTAYLVQDFYEPLKERHSLVTFEDVRVLGDVPEKYFNENNAKFLGGE